MTGKAGLRRALLWTTVLAALAFLAGLASARDELSDSERRVGRDDCTFAVDREDYLTRESRQRRELFERVRAFAKSEPQRLAAAAVPADRIPRRNFIDDEIFGRLAARGIPSAPLASDAEFLRRVSLDLTGRLPTPEQIRSFLADPSPDKRDRLIDRLLDSPEFVDKWTMWLGDLLENNAQASNFSRQINGRNAFHHWIRSAIAQDKSFRDIAYETISWRGNNYDNATGAVNWAASARTPMGPIQDTYDAMLARTATVFLGLGHYDCLLCHDGRGHLEQVSLWGARATRAEAWRMAAFFSRMSLNTRRVSQDDFYYLSVDVGDASSGNYALNTNYGNRPPRRPIGTLTSINPEYRLHRATPADGNWRKAFVDNLIQDPMFARNWVNRIWKQMFNYGLAEPVDALDPARLDPDKPPSEPWTFQTAHPVLLERLAGEFRNLDFHLRPFLRLLAQSSAYQLSARYDGEWKLDYVPLFARRYPRRLEGEEIHDAIAQATGVLGRYTVQGWTEPVLWAMQLPEPVEPRSNRAVANFMNAFFRGNRDTQQRSQSGSILQQLNLMNDNFVLSRVRVSASPTLQAVAQLPTNGAALDELFLLFLGRLPTATERAAGLAHLDKAASTAQRRAAIEDLAWVCINKTDFLFSY
ncbi:MAG: DUF1549 domain-containing protein [Bryobacterales bacterium]|nr:DUF1549 domain-containing protein [Bryobacteraceae bacterium]MDW8355916.1 DUF1549 domain-containing protein [Bryobacterales bacterium]